MKTLTDMERLQLALEWGNAATRAMFDNPSAMRAGDLVDIAATAYLISLLNFFVNVGVQIAKAEPDSSQQEVVAKIADEFLEKFEKLIKPILKALPQEGGVPVKLGGFGLDENGEMAVGDMVPAIPVMEPFPVGIVQSGSEDEAEAVRLATEAGLKTIYYRGMTFVMGPGGIPEGLTVEEFAEAMVQVGALFEQEDGTLCQNPMMKDQSGALDLGQPGDEPRLMSPDEVKEVQKKMRKKLN